MKNMLRAIGAGLALGLALFLVPLLGRVLVFVLLLRVAFRLLGGRRRRRFGAGRLAFGEAFGPGAPVPIDNQWPATAPMTGPAKYVPVN